MVQSYILPIGTDFAHVALKTLIPDSLEALRSLHSGAAEPSSRIPYMLWADTTSGFLKIRNAANNAWLKVAPLASEGSVIACPGSQWDVASLTGTTTKKIGFAPRAGTILRLTLLCETASSSSSGNEWRPQVVKYPNSAPGSPVNLFSGTVGTFTVLSGVGGGVEFAANKVLEFTPNQNATVLQGDVLELVMTEAGTATNLTNFTAVVLME